jgi:hypothetical protein
MSFLSLFIVYIIVFGFTYWMVFDKDDNRVLTLFFCFTWPLWAAFIFGSMLIDDIGEFYNTLRGRS